MARKTGGARKTVTKTGKPVKFDEEGNRLTLDGRIDGRLRTGAKNARNSPTIRDALDLGDPDDNRRRIQFVTELAFLPDIDIRDLSQLEHRLGEYLLICDKYGMKTGNQAMCLALGMSVDTLITWSNGGAPTPPITDFAKKARAICSTFREGYMQDGKVNPVTGIFWQKNYDGLKDQQEHVITPNNPLGDKQDVTQLQKRYLDSLPDPDDK